MTGRNRDQDAYREAPPVPWHNRTSTLLGASVAGVAAIAVLVVSISWGTRQFNEPQQTPVNYVDPAFSTSETSRPARTTTQTITSTQPPITSDINPDLPSVTEDTETTERTPNYRPPRTREDEPDEESETRTTRNRPRTNVTRTLNPAP